MVLWLVGQAVWANTGEDRALGSQLKKLAARFHEFLMAHAILVLQVEIEAGGVTQLQYRWRNHRIYQGVSVL
ncbi:hypothetical protein D3C81_2095060 [compost metagenome]